MGNISSKKNENWYADLEDFEVSHKIQPVMIWQAVVRMGSRTRTLVLRAVNVNWNDNGWNVNANSVENPNRWNEALVLR